MDPQNHMSNTELQSSLKSCRRKAKLWETLGILCGVILMILLFFGQFLGLLLLIPAILCSFFWASANGRIKNMLSSEIINGVMREVLDNAVYAAPDRLSDEIISSSYMVFPFSYDKIGGDDAVSGEYKGIPLKMSDVVLRQRVETGDGEENQTVFEGQWLVCDFGRVLPGEVQLSQLAKDLPKGIIKQRILTANEQFDNKFVVTANNPEEAFNILTPQMMDFCLDLAGRNEGSVYMSFLRDGKVHVAVNSGTGFFELGKNNPDPEKLRQVFLDQLHWYTDIVDGLLAGLRR